MKFTIVARDAGARAGELQTAHGVVHTPAFMPVGSKGAVKGIHPNHLREVGVEILLSNAYHLRLRPGDDLVRAQGGLHRFMGWSGSILTDSGGYQILSLARRRRITPEGVEFQSHIDGSPVSFTPESVLDIQANLGSDIAMPLDDPAPGGADLGEAARAMETTLDWFDRSYRRWNGGPQALFPIVQGGMFVDLRRECAERLIRYDAPGYAIGGLSVGEPKETTTSVTGLVASLLPPDRPRYLMGVGTPGDIVRSVALGIDLFDCILPTRMGRTGWAYTSAGRIKIRNAEFRDAGGPIDPQCDCLACRSYPRSLLRHYFSVGELLGPASLSLHNIAYYQRLMRKIRGAILEGRFQELLCHVDLD